ncbi:MAG: GNAT family N-acetyltransferase [Eubacteriales bacterium]|nr:GNAT family N-acetyltransferase [Eubacteriales bacterium]
MSITIASLSAQYEVRALTSDDLEAILDLCAGNPLYYEHCPPPVSARGILHDMTALPPHTDPADKYYVGFYQAGSLIAVLDLIDGYPEKGVAFIGFFMTHPSVQKKGVGSRIVQGICAYLKAAGFSAVRLAWVTGNPQAEHFWLINGFVPIKETSSTAAPSVMLAQRTL